VNSLDGYQVVDSYWYDQVPSYWKKTKNKYVFCQDKHVVGEDWEKFTLLTMGKSGVKPRDMDGGGKFPASFETYQTVEPNQLIFCLFDLDETPRTIGMSKDYGMITSAYDVFTTTEGNDPQFWTYFYQMIDDHKGLRPFYTGLRKVVRSETFMGIEVFSPPLEEQKLISRYLDKKTEQIDRLVEKIQKKIELLKEQRTSLINQCVTKGLDPNVEMKDSGIEWIGEIPKHWMVKKVKYLGLIKSGEGITATDLLDVGDYKVYGGNGIVGLFNKFNVENTVIVIGRVGEKCGNIHLVKEKSWISDNSLILELGDPEYYDWTSLALEIRDLNKIRNQSSQPLITGTQVKNESIPFPPKNEFTKISTFIQTSNSRFSDLIEKQIKRIELLKEYRQSLISSAVTGKIRITEDMI
jgi:type I restriction enzyme, S subunit